MRAMHRRTATTSASSRALELPSGVGARTMKTMRREICWLAVCVFVAAIAAVPLVAVVNGRWASEAALGDVVISYDNVVRFYDNATGDEKDSNPSTPLGISVPGNNFGIAFDGALNLFV